MTDYYDNKVAQTATIATLALHLFFSFAKQASYTTHYIIILVATTTTTTTTTSYAIGSYYMHGNSR
jgi:hypothetical protein